MPLILSLWTPIMWILEDCGIKIIDNTSSGDISSIKSVAEEIKNGFHTIIGFGAIIGIGTTVSTSLVTLITNSTISTQYLNYNLSNIFNINYSPFINLALWIIVFLLISFIVTINGMFIMSNSYLTNDHLGLVKKIRSELISKGMIVATVPKFVTEQKSASYFVNDQEI